MTLYKCVTRQNDKFMYSLARYTIKCTEIMCKNNDTHKIWFD